MVFFNCNACGEALKKNQVEKHTYRCRQCQAVSCVDCGKDFWGSEYQAHTKCMTEDEKYCGKGYIAKVNKGEVKQEQWIEKVQGAITKASSNLKLKGLLERLQDYPNIPRKKPKFENFLKNSLRVLSPALISQVWDLLMTAANTTPESKQNGATASCAASNNDSKSSVDSSQINADQKQEVETQATEIEDKEKLNKRERKEERQKKSKKEKKDKVGEESIDNNDNVRKKKKRKHEVTENNEDLESLVNDENVKKSKKRKREEVFEDQSNLSEEPVEGKKKKRDKQTDGDPSNSLKPVLKKKTKKKDDSLQGLFVNGTGGNDSDRGDVNEQVADEPARKKKFKWGATIIALLEKKGEMSLKKLRRKVLSEFSAQDAANYNEENLTAKFNKKLSKIQNVSVLKERVKLK